LAYGNKKNGLFTAQNVIVITQLKKLFVMVKEDINAVIVIIGL